MTTSIKNMVIKYYENLKTITNSEEEKTFCNKLRELEKKNGGEVWFRFCYALLKCLLEHAKTYFAHELFSFLMLSQGHTEKKVILCLETNEQKELGLRDTIEAFATKHHIALEDQHLQFSMDIEDEAEKADEEESEEDSEEEEENNDHGRVEYMFVEKFIPPFVDLSNVCFQLSDMYNKEDNKPLRNWFFSNFRSYPHVFGENVWEECIGHFIETMDVDGIRAMLEVNRNQTFVLPHQLIKFVFKMVANVETLEEKKEHLLQLGSILTQFVVHSSVPNKENRSVGRPKPTGNWTPEAPYEVDTRCYAPLGHRNR